MIFGPTRLRDAGGAILAHSLTAGTRKLKKGLRLGPEEIAALEAAGFVEIIAARLGDDDVHEDEAAQVVGRAFAPAPEAACLSMSAPFTGRLNLYALTGGVLEVDAEAVNAVNALHEAITIATLPDKARMRPRQMAATVKIIPYAAPRAAVEDACAILSAAARPIRLRPPRLRRAGLILTETPGLKPSLLEKGEEAVRARLTALGVELSQVVRVPHAAAPLARALRDLPGDVALILGGSATSDRRDVGPGAVEAAGGTVDRFGMPVDPGNLMFLGTLPGEAGAARPVVGLPGCVRSPALNGVDWVLERLVCGIEISASDIAGMGVGGLLKEIPSRPQPRSGGAAAPERPQAAAILLAAGASRRMGGRDKLVEDVAGEPALRRAARALLQSGVDGVWAVLRPGDARRRKALEGLPVKIVENPEASEGMASSIRAGLAALGPEMDAAVVALADMPEVGAEHVDRLLAAFDPGEGRAICRAVDSEGRPGHPVLFGRRFFESLSRLSGDEGARDILRANEEFVTDVPTPGRAARLDLDTPEAWAAWRAELAGR
ncbi:NTP transferase domain-containing protein [Rhodovulum sp. DZ06]|uniref:NTP transferase domain-containing protein n=1 Tax=Rhodovulum sp. DZ06 TaxID=3425126 RepID=UPI003D333ADA